ncbi:MAG TPA: ATP-binding protein [Negativicutes bacterium]|nr:ATP-binding protein [Negativicutes bacterium]
MKRSLQTKLFVSFMLVVSLILVGFAVGASALVRQYFLTAKQQELVGKGQEMSVVLNDFLTGKISSVQLVELVDRIDGFLDARIWAVDGSRRVIVMSTPRRGHRTGTGPGQGMGPGTGPGMNLGANPQQGKGNGAGTGAGQGGMRSSTAVRNLLNDIEPVFRGEVLTRTFFHPYYGEDMMIVAVPIQNEAGESNGAVILNAPVQGLNDFLTRIYLAIGLIGLLALALTLFIVRRLSRGIVKPLRAMEETAASMAQGCYDKRVEVTSQDEVGQLGASFNTLAHELSRFVERTEQMEKLRRDFVANVSHELRTPLTIIRGYTEALQDGTVTDPEQAARFNKLIVNETERLERLINDLLDLSRLQAQQYAMETEPIPLVEVVDSVVSMLQGKAMEKEIVLSWRYDDNPSLIRGNGDRLVQLLLILLDNALKYTPVHGKVSVDLTHSTTQVVLTITDTGAGIPVEDLPLVWERFYKVDKAHTRENQGTGLGLSIAREIIDRHGARVSVTSELGIGTTFVLQFPALAPKG